MTEVFKVEVCKRLLREYYNEVCGIMEDLDNEELDNEEIDVGQSERALMQLDEKYASKLSLV